MDSTTNQGHERPTLSLHIDSGPASPLESGASTKFPSPATSGQKTPREDLLRLRAEMERIRHTSRYDGQLAECSSSEAELLRSGTTSPVSPPLRSPPQRRITRTPSPIRDPGFLNGSMIEYSATWLKNHPELVTPVPKRPWPQDVSQAGEELGWQLDPEVRIRIEEEHRRHRRAREDGRSGGREDFLERLNVKKARDTESKSSSRTDCRRPDLGPCADRMAADPAMNAPPPGAEAPKKKRGLFSFWNKRPWARAAPQQPKDVRAAWWKRALVRQIIATCRAIGHFCDWVRSTYSSLLSSTLIRRRPVQVSV